MRDKLMQLILAELMSEPNGETKFHYGFHKYKIFDKDIFKHTESPIYSISGRDLPGFTLKFEDGQPDIRISTHSQIIKKNTPSVKLSFFDKVIRFFCEVKCNETISLEYIYETFIQYSGYSFKLTENEIDVIVLQSKLYHVANVRLADEKRNQVLIDKLDMRISKHEEGEANKLTNKNKRYYRVCNKKTLQGLWYDYNGSYTGLIHEGFAFCTNNKLEMGFDPEIVGWLSATDSLDSLWNWFTKEDITKLQKYGWYIHEFEAEDVKFYERFQHLIINQDTSKLLRIIDVDSLGL